MVKLQYVITNASKKLYIKLGASGKPETCSNPSRQLFEHDKAQNVLDNLPKTFKKFHFRVEAVSENTADTERKEKEKKKTIRPDEYVVPDTVKVWLDKVASCNNLAKDALKRKEELVIALSNIDRDISNLTHKVRLEKKQNACAGYKRYREWKQLVDERGNIKDELIVVSTILDSNLSSIATDRIRKTVEKLSSRCFEIREHICNKVENT